VLLQEVFEVVFCYWLGRPGRLNSNTQLFRHSAETTASISTTFCSIPTTHHELRTGGGVCYLRFPRCGFVVHILFYNKSHQWSLIIKGRSHYARLHLLLTALPDFLDIFGGCEAAKKGMERAGEGANGREGKRGRTCTQRRKRNSRL